MLNGTAKISVTDYDEGGFVINDVNMRGGVALYPEIAMVRPYIASTASVVGLDCESAWLTHVCVCAALEAKALRGDHQRELDSVHSREPAHWYAYRFTSRSCGVTSDICANHSCVLCHVLEILVLGCGARIQHNLASELKEMLKVNGIVVEYLDSVNACATFNILNAEDRKVAAAILPYDADAVKVV